MTARHDEPGKDDQDDLERASIADLLAELAQIEDAIRSAAEAGYPLTAGLARRENAIIDALRRRDGRA